MAGSGACAVATNGRKKANRAAFRDSTSVRPSTTADFPLPGSIAVT